METQQAFIMLIPYYKWDSIDNSLVTFLQILTKKKLLLWAPLYKGQENQPVHCHVLIAYDLRHLDFIFHPQRAAVSPFTEIDQ